MGTQPFPSHWPAGSRTIDLDASEPLPAFLRGTLSSSLGRRLAADSHSRNPAAVMVHIPALPGHGVDKLADVIPLDQVCQFLIIFSIPIPPLLAGDSFTWLVPATVAGWAIAGIAMLADQVSPIPLLSLLLFFAVSPVIMNPSFPFSHVTHRPQKQRARKLRYRRIE